MGLKQSIPKNVTYKPEIIEPISPLPVNVPAELTGQYIATVAARGGIEKGMQYVAQNANTIRKDVLSGIKTIANRLKMTL